MFPNGEGGDCKSPAIAYRFDSYLTHHINLKYIAGSSPAAPTIFNLQFA